MGFVLRVRVRVRVRVRGRVRVRVGLGIAGRRRGKAVLSHVAVLSY